jgi:uncharacterized protein YhhL (DUF1145 family)
VYPSRTPVLRWPTNVLGAIWGVLLFVMMWEYPAIPQPVLYASLVFPVYYFGLSLILQLETAKAAKSAKTTKKSR